MKRVISILLVCISVFVMASCSFENRDADPFDTAEPRTYEYVCDKGLRLTTDVEFSEAEEVSQTYELVNSECLFSALKEEFDVFVNLDYDPDTMTVRDYTDLLYYVNGFDGEMTEEEGGYISFTYEDEVDGETYFYYGLSFKGSDAFWFCNFACETDKAEELTPKFKEWAKNIVIE